MTVTLKAGQSFGEFIEELYRSRYTGKILLDCLNGVPRFIELPGPRVPLASPIDKRRKLADTVPVSG